MSLTTRAFGLTGFGLTAPGLGAAGTPGFSLPSSSSKRLFILASWTMALSRRDSFLIFFSLYWVIVRRVAVLLSIAFSSIVLHSARISSVSFSALRTCSRPSLKSLTLSLPSLSAFLRPSSAPSSSLFAEFTRLSWASCLDDFILKTFPTASISLPVIALRSITAAPGSPIPIPIGMPSSAASNFTFALAARAISRARFSSARAS